MDKGFRDIIEKLKKQTNKQENLLQDELIKNIEFNNFLIIIKKKVR